MIKHRTPTLRPLPRALRAILLALPLAAAQPFMGSHAHAQEAAQAVRSYDIPAGALSSALTRFAAEAGILLSADAALTAGKTTRGLRGSYSPDEGLARLLDGTGLEGAASAGGGYTLKPKPKAQTRPAPSAPAATAKEDGVLPVVMVTGEKIERRLDDTVSSVVVATAKDIQEHGDRHLNDVMMRTPGVYIASGNELWGVRGVPVSGFDDQGPATLNGAVSVTVDGAVQAHRTLTMNPLSLWDVEQVEIFHGAQSTVQGRNALAGAVVVQTRDPGYRPELAAQLHAGNDGQQGAAFVVGGGLVDGHVAGRLAVDYQEQDGYIHNETLDRDASRRRSLNARAKLLVQPTDRLEMLFGFARTEHRMGDNAVAQQNGRPVYYKLFYNTDAKDEIEQDAATARVTWYFDDAWTLTSLTSSTRTRYDSLLDFDQGPDDRWEVIRAHDGELVNQELRLGYQSATLRGHVGAYWGRNTYAQDDRLDVEGTTFGRIIADTEVINRAVFGELNWDFTDAWQLIAGMRYDRERNDTRFDQDDFSSAGGDSQDASVFLPKLGLAWRVAPDQLLSAQVQRGYRSGGVNVRAGAAHTAYDAEFTTTYELGHRGAFLAKRLRTAANLYHTDWRDQQVAIENADGFAQVVNAGRSRMNGIELSAEFDATRALRLNAGAAYGHTKYVDFVSNAGDLSGEAFLFAPRYKLSFGGSYRVDDRLTIGADVVHQPGSPSAYITDSSGRVTDTRRSDRVTLVNATASYRVNKSLELSAYVKNVFDQQYITNNQQGTVLDVGAPRTFGVALRADL